MHNHATLCLFTLAMVVASGVDTAELREAAEIKLASATTEPSILELLRAGDDATAAKLMKQSSQMTSATPIEWVPCTDYQQTAGLFPLMETLDGDFTGLSLSQCTQWCNDRSDCGGFVFWGTWCLLYNINDAIVDDHLFPGMLYDTGLSDLLWYSKTCQYKAGCRYCKEYGSHVYNKQRITNQQHWIMSNEFHNVAGLTAGVCQNWCTLYEDCKSVAYRVITDIPLSGHCELYSTTIQELINNGQGADVSFHWRAAINDRHCCPPYNP